jgi:hypothetical protein
MVYFEIIGFYSIFLLVLFAFTEATKKYPIGIVASVLMCVLGLWLLTDGIQIKTSETINTTANTTLTNLTVDTGTVTWNYQDIPETPYMPIQNVIGFVLVSLSLYGGLSYTMEMFSQ